MEEEDPSTRKILEARQINFSLGVYAEVFVSVVNSKEGIKDLEAYPLNDPKPFLCGLSPVLGSS